MAEESLFRGILTFLDRLGIYDVVLPFLLVFAIVFAILEKTKVLGTEEIAGKKLTKKNLNAIVSFVISFLVVASGKLVQAITKISANIVILLLASVSFLLLVGSFMKQGEVALEGKWKYTFMAIMFIGLLIIFLNAFETESGNTWLEESWNYLVSNWTSTTVASLILLVVLIGGVMYITQSTESSEKKKKEES